MCQREAVHRELPFHFQQFIRQFGALQDNVVAGLKGCAVSAVELIGGAPGLVNAGRLVFRVARLSRVNHFQAPSSCSFHYISIHGHCILNGMNGFSI